jgi:hypothetical protein
MSKYSRYEGLVGRQRRQNNVHPIWQAIGCSLMILIPLLAYAGAAFLVQANLQQRWLPLPRELARAVHLPVIGFVPYLYANLVVMLPLTVVGFGVLTILYALVYRLVSPSR